MSWGELQLPAQQARVAARKAVTATCLPASRFRPSLAIAFRPLMMRDAPAWLRAGAEVAVLGGSGEHAGWLRIGTTGETRMTIGRLPGRGGKSVLQLRLPSYPGLPAEKRGPVALEWRVAGAWLEVKLPAWLETPAEVAAKQPFVGLGATGHEQTFSGRRGSGPIPAGGRP